MVLADKVAVVTGSGGAGCGRAIARRLARDGASLVASDINEDGGCETVRQIEAAGGRAAFFRADVRSETDMRALVEFAVRRFGGLTLLVNNASGGIHEPGGFFDHFAATLQIELFGTLYATRFAMEAIRRSGGGAIVNMSSISGLWHGRKKPVGFEAYDVAKCAVIRLTTTLAPLAEKEGVRVNCLAPGWIATEEVRTYWESLTLDQRLERGAPSKLLQPEEIADAVVRLATDESLCGRILVWWSEDSPTLIRWGDRGYGE